MKKTRKASPKMVKLLNRELIINELRQNPNQSRADLAKKTNLSKPTVSEIVKELIEEGLVFETGFGPSSGGKRPILLKYNARSNYVLGVLIENDTIFIALGDMNGEIVRLDKKIFEPPVHGRTITEMIVDGVVTLCKEENIGKGFILGMTVGVSGIPGENEAIISTSPTIQWEDFNMKKALSDALHIDVIIENDVNLMTIGEFYKGKGKGVTNFIYLFIGDGIGSGLFLNGQFYKGAHSASGEIGFMMIGDEKMAKPNLGVFEANYGRFGIREFLKSEGIPIEPDTSFINHLQSRRHDQKIQAILNEIICQWAKATINIISIIDPKVVIFSGELIHLDKVSLAQFTSFVEKYVPKMPELKITELGSKAGLYGAFHLALDHFHVDGFKHTIKQ